MQVMMDILTTEEEMMESVLQMSCTEEFQGIRFFLCI